MAHFPNIPTGIISSLSSLHITEETALSVGQQGSLLCVDEIAQMMQIDLTLRGDERAFRRRLLKTLNATEEFWKTGNRH
ncbi:MAG: hypothetical protein AB7S81_08985 [Bdellovibrionales bacterium]